jgi:hypothetical protein
MIFQVDSTHPSCSLLFLVAFVHPLTAYATQPFVLQGTSAPIAIPNMGTWRAGADGKGSGRQQDAASTFIPPHQLSRQEDFTFSFNGASPSATLKRERLRARNAILRSTGVLPVACACAAGLGGGGEVPRVTR